jgi:hypothetical protein
MLTHPQRCLINNNNIGFDKNDDKIVTVANASFSLIFKYLTEKTIQCIDFCCEQTHLPLCTKYKAIMYLV